MQGHLDFLQKQGEDIAQSPFMGGNRVELLRDGKDAYPAMLETIAKADSRIDMESYTFDDEEGKNFAAALMKRHAAGVEVNLMYDAWGSSETSSEIFDLLRTGGIRVVEYNPVDPVNILDTSFNHRDHRKLLLVDGKIGFVGGVNISAVYNLKRKVERAVGVGDDDIDIAQLPWRDIHARIEGPVITEFEKLFSETWNDQDGEPYLDIPATLATPEGPTLIQAIEGAPDLDRYAIYHTLLMAIALARVSVHLTTAYFVPTPDLIHELEKAARRGVDVRLILPGYSDSDMAIKAAHAYYQDMMEAGIHVYERQNVVLHTKTGVIDGIWSTIGSSNLDWRSVVFNNECNAVILGAPFGQQMEDLFKEDLSQSVPIDAQKWADRSFWQRLDEWKSRAIEFML
jgi:cardiolipin synthase